MFILGAMLVFLGFLLIVLSNATKYIMKDAEQEARDQFFLIAFSVGLAIFIIGLALAFIFTIYRLPREASIRDYLDDYYQKEGSPIKQTMIFSLSLSRLISGILFLIMGLIDLFILTSAIGHHNSPYGQTIVLGGPSAFYPVALFPTIFGLGLVLYTLGSSHRFSIAQTEEVFHFHEFRAHKSRSTALEKDEIEAMRYQNNQVGPKFIWLIILIPLSVLTIYNGTAYLFAPLLTDPTQGILFYYSAITELVVLFFLLMKPQQYWEIATKTDLYEYWIEPFSKDLKSIPRLTEEISEVFELKPDQAKSEAFMEKANLKPAFKDYNRIFIGIFFIATSIPMLSFQVLFGQFYYWFALFFGSICIIKGLSRDFSDGDLIESDTAFKFKRRSNVKGISKFYHYRTFEPTDAEITKQFRKLDFFEVMILPLMVAFMMIQVVQSWYISSTLTMLLSSLWSTLFMVLVVLIVLIYLCMPIDQIKIMSPTIEYYIPVKLNDEKFFDLKSALSDSLKTTFILRFLIIMLILVGSLIGTLIYLIMV